MAENILRKVCWKNQEDSAENKMKKISGTAVHFLAILAAFFSSVAAKTEAGKNLQRNLSG